MPQIDRINGLIGSIAVKVPCKAATTANITLSGAQTIDGVSLVSGDRCLVKDQATASENGIYDVSATEWSRSQDFNGQRDVAQGTCVRIISGTVSGQYFYEVTTADPIIGNTDIDFALVNFPNTTSSYIATLLDDLNAAAARATLVAAGTTDNNTFSGTQTFQKTVYWKKGADIPSANDLPLTTDGNYNDITGTTTINGFTDGVQNEVRKFHFDASLTLKHDTTPTAGFSKLWIPSESDYVTSINNEIEFIYDGTYWRLTSTNISNFFRGALVWQTAGFQTFTSDALGVIAFANETYDTSSIHDNATNNSRLTVPAGVTKVKLWGQVQINDTDATKITDQSYIYLPINGGGGSGDRGFTFIPTPHGSISRWQVTSPVVDVIAGDYFELGVHFTTSDSSAISVAGGEYVTCFAMEIIE